MPSGLLWAARNGHSVYRFRFANGLATSRAHSMKSRATGLSVRPFRVMIRVGRRVADKSTGNTLSEGCLVGKCSCDSWSTVRKCPVASKVLRKGTELVVTVARGTSSPFARKASTSADPKR